MIRTTILTLLCVSLITLPRVAAADSISMVVGTQARGSCELGSDGGLVILSVVHWPQISGATGARYRVSACNSALVLFADVPRFEGISGDFDSGYVVDYGECLEGPIVVQTLYFVGNGTSPANSSIRIMPHRDAASGLVEETGCQNEVYYPEPGGICIKSDGSACLCNQLGPPYHHIPCEEIVPVESSSWGQVKALYR